MNNTDNSRTNRIKTKLKEIFPGMVPLFVIAHFLHHVPGFIIQSVLPSIRDTFKLTYFQTGELTAAYQLAYGVSNLPAGWLGDRIGPRILIAIGVAGVAFCGLIIGIAPTYWLIVCALIIMGILGGGYHPSASPLISDVTPLEKRGRILGIHQVGGTIANFVTPLLATGVATVLTWRGSYIVLSVPIIAFGIILYLILKRRHLGDTVKKITNESFVIRINPPGYLRRMIAFLTIGTVVQIFVLSTLSFIPLLVTDQFKGTVQAGAAFLSLAHFAGFWAGPVGGHMSDRIGKVPIMLVVGLAAGPIIYLLSLGSNWWLLPIVLLGLGTCTYVAMPVSEAYVISNATQHNRSTILGIYYCASRGGIGILTPIIGKLIDHGGFGRAFAIEGAAIFVIVLICALFLWESRADRS